MKSRRLHGFAWVMFLGISAGPSLAADSTRGVAQDTQYSSEQMSLESARYLFDIEGDTNAAQNLVDRLQQSEHEEIRTQAHYLQGRFLEEQGHAKAAVLAYSEALKSKGLSASEKLRRLVTRLLALNPAILQPLQPAGKASGPPARIFPTVEGNATRYVLVEDAENSEEKPSRLSWQDAEGMLHPLSAGLAPGEEVLDATPEALVTLPRGKQEVLLRKAPSFTASPISEKFAVEEATLFSSDPDELLLVGPQGLRLIRRGQTVYSHSLPGPGCSYRPSSPRSRQGILFCPTEGVYRADFSRRVLSPLTLGGDPPSDATLFGDYLALRYADHVEIRRGPAFDAFLWGFPANMQDPLTLSREHAFLVGGEGQLRAFDLRTGQLDWQRNDDISEVVSSGNELFALTHDETCLAMDEKGRTLFYV